jgi:hypothetical protein
MNSFFPSTAGTKRALTNKVLRETPALDTHAILRMKAENTPPDATLTP